LIFPRTIIALFAAIPCASWCATSKPHSATQTPPEIKPQYVENPFGSQKSIDAFRDYVAAKSLDLGLNIQIPGEFYKAAPLIQYWGYQFTPIENAYKVAFVQKYDAKGMLKALVDVVGTVGHSNCSSYHARNPQISAITLKEIDAIASIDGTENVCVNLLVGEVKTWVGDITGSANGKITYHLDSNAVDPTGKYKGSLVADTPVVNGEAHAKSVFGIDAGTVGGQLLTAISHLALAPIVLVRDKFDQSAWNTINIFNGGLWKADSLSISQVLYAEASKGHVLSSGYTKFIAQVNQFTWGSPHFFQLSDMETGFMGSIQEPVLQEAFETNVNFGYESEIVLADIDQELRLLRSFGENPQLVTIVRGDTLWKAASRTYGSPFYYAMLAAANNLDRTTHRSLRPGKTLIAPPLYKLEILSSTHFMRPGETITQICRDGFKLPEGMCIKAFARANPNLPLSDLYALEGVHVPEFKKAGVVEISP
jgi:LysM domain